MEASHGLNRYRLQHLRQAFAARFELEGFLGRGAFASVYLVRNLKLRRREALKILSDSFDPGSGLEIGRASCRERVLRLV